MSVTMPDAPYYDKQSGIAPINADYVRWDLVNSNKSRRDNVDDDAAEGSGRPAKKIKLDPSSPAKLSKKAMRRAKQAADAAHLCLTTARDKNCPLLPNCKFLHDLEVYMQQKESDLCLPALDDCKAVNKQADISTSAIPSTCPAYDEYGICFQGHKCRFLASHSVATASAVRTLLFDEEKMRKSALLVLENPAKIGAMPFEELKAFMYSTKGEQNNADPSTQRLFRGKREESFPLTYKYFESIGKPWKEEEQAQQNRRGKGKGLKEAAKTTHYTSKDTTVVDEGSAITMTAPLEELESSIVNEEIKTPSSPASVELVLENHTLQNSAKADVEVFPFREKKRLDFRNKLYLAPLTTNGNLPFRRICVEYGADITCGEMGLASEFLGGNPSEWSLVRRHPSERFFGAQIAGSRPTQLIPCAEALLKACPKLDFIDVNCGCPIDLIFKKGAGSALLDHVGKLGASLVGMSKVMGEIPMTVKMRTGVRAENTAHNVILKASSDWGVSAVTLHGRSRQQRYSKLANYEYISQCVKELRQQEEAQNLPRMPFIGNGDAYDQKEYWDTVENTGVDTIMVARGALIKPWIFTELKERRTWDISAQERLEGIAKMARYGLSHWGSDTQGVNTTRKFMLEALSFQHRYIPVGLLERFPARMNERPHPFSGRNDLETLLASPLSDDWQRIADMFLGKPPETFQFVARHKANATSGEAEG